MAKVKGIIDFYGYVDNYNGDGKEYTLAIKNPVFSDLDWEEINSLYTDDKGKLKLPKLYTQIQSGDIPEVVYFRSSQYPINKVSVYNKDTKEVTVHEVENPALKGLPVVMKFKKQYIGSLLLDRVPEEFKPVAFSDDDLEDLPF